MADGRFITSCLAVMLLGAVSAQNTVKIDAVQANSYGVTYSLPKTELSFIVTAVKTQSKAGKYHTFAKTLLGIENVVESDNVSFQLFSVEAFPYSIPDKDNTYMVRFNPKTIAPFVTLTEEGLIYAINRDSLPAPQKPFKGSTQALNVPKQESNPEKYLSEEILAAGSTAKQAELIAKQILAYRQRTADILTGEADEMPPDGAAYTEVLKRLDEQTKALTMLFTGETFVDTIRQQIIVPIGVEDINRAVLFRFSQKLGIVAADDLAGEPVYWSLINKDNYTPPLMNEQERKVYNRKFSNGIIYNLPATAGLKIEYAGNTLLDRNIEVVQMGRKEALTDDALLPQKGKTISIIFDPQKGTVRSINQTEQPLKP